MKTIVEKITKEQLNTEEGKKIIGQAGDFLKEGGLVAFPTETVYGLGADALNKSASTKIYAAKGRPSDNPLIVHITNMGALDKIADIIPEVAYKVADAYWPGPLTMIFQKTEEVPYETTGGLDTVAVRMPSDEIARALIDAGGGYIADTPGFSSFETEQMDLVLAEDLQYAFPEFEPYLGQCQFTGCAHVKEKGCAVLAAVEAGEIARSRHESYVKLYDSVKDLKQWEISKGGTR